MNSQNIIVGGKFRLFQYGILSCLNLYFSEVKTYQPVLVYTYIHTQLEIVIFSYSNARVAAPVACILAMTQSRPPSPLTFIPLT